MRLVEQSLSRRPFAAPSILGTVAALAMLVGLALVPTGAAAANATPSTAPSFEVPTSAFAPAEVETLLGGVPLADLNNEELSAVLAKAPGLGSFPEGTLKQALAKALTSLAGENATLGQLKEGSGLIAGLQSELGKLLSLPELLALLKKGETLSGALTGALASLTPSNIVDSLLAGSGKPEELLAGLLGSLAPQALQGVLGSTLAGQFAPSTVEGLANQLGLSASELATTLGTTASQLPATGLALTAPLANGKTLGILNGLGGLTLTLLNPTPVTPPTKEESAGEKGGTGGGGAGGAGGAASGGSGSTGSATPGLPGATTIILNSTPAAAPTAVSAANHTVAALRVKILSRKIRGSQLVLVLQIPSAGRLLLAGRGVVSRHAQFAGAQRYTIRTRLTRAAGASLHARHARHILKVKIALAFKANGLPVSSTTTTVSFR